MKSKFIKKPGSIIELEAELDQKEFQGYWQAAYDNAFSKVNLKGFRPGTAPKELADQAVNKEHVFEEAAHKAIRFSLDEISKDNQWNFIDTPKIELQESPLGLKYKATIPPIASKCLRKTATRLVSPKIARANPSVAQ